MRRLPFLLLLLAIVPSAAAQQDFEAVVSGVWSPAACFITPIMSSALQWFGPDRLERDISGGPEVVQVASGNHRRVFGLKTGFGVRIVELSPAGTQTPFFEGLAGTSPTAIAVAPNGRIFVGHFQAGLPRVAVISAAGTLEATYPLPGMTGSRLFAAGNDSCTLFYRTATAIARFDACTGTPLPDFAPAGELIDVEVLPDGRVLGTTPEAVLLYSAAGVVERTVASASNYGPEGAFDQAALSVDGTAVYIAFVNVCEASGVLLKVTFDTGGELSRRALGFGSANGLVTGLAVATVPTASELGLLALAVTLALAGIYVTKLSK